VYAILFVLLLLVLAAGAFLTHLMNASEHDVRHSTGHVVQSTAQQAAQILNACDKETSAGVYSVANLVSAGYLPSGFSPDSAMGPSWGCQVSSGGVNGKNVVLLLMSGPFTTLPGKGKLAATSNGANLQTQMAWLVAQDIGSQVAAMDNTVVGVIPNGSTTLYSIQSQQQYDLSGLIGSPAFSTPTIARNLVATTVS
jgi:hypothetical protein